MQSFFSTRFIKKTLKGSFFPHQVTLIHDDANLLWSMCFSFFPLCHFSCQFFLFSSCSAHAHLCSRCFRSSAPVHIIPAFIPLSVERCAFFLSCSCRCGSLFCFWLINVQFFHSNFLFQPIFLGPVLTNCDKIQQFDLQKLQTFPSLMTS